LMYPVFIPPPFSTMDQPIPETWNCQNVNVFNWYNQNIELMLFRNDHPYLLKHRNDINMTTKTTKTSTIIKYRNLWKDERKKQS
jgi:hypothetical protein